jgi:pyruvate formate lyase activating enzyme
MIGTAPAQQPSSDTLAGRLAALTVPGTLYEPAGMPTVRCTACAHACVIDEGRTGACGVRSNRAGVLHVPHGYVARRYVRPVETNTIYHVRPGTRALIFGMFGCDLRCPYCHNWKVSQALREGIDDRPHPIDAAGLVGEARAAGCAVVAAAYNEPMIAAEWAHDVFAEARRHGLTTALISDGHTTPAALRFMRPVTDVLRVDLKAATEDAYRALGGRRAPVIDAIREARRLGYWVEVVTLVVPGFNDVLAELRTLAAELLAIDAGIPWHLNAFHPRYRMSGVPRTSAAVLASAVGMAYARGLRFVYASNLAGQLHELASTRCPSCTATVVERHDYVTRAVHLDDGRCRRCATHIPGIY